MTDGATADRPARRWGRRLAVAAAAVAVAAGVAVLVRDSGASFAVEVPDEAGTATPTRLSDGTPVIATRDADGDVHVLDARVDRGGPVTWLVAVCRDEPVLTTGSLAGMWTLAGRPLVPEPSRFGEPEPARPGNVELARFAVDAVRGGVASLGQRVPGDADPEPVTATRQPECVDDPLATHDPPPRRRPVAELARAPDGRYAVDGVVEQRGDGRLRLCELPADVDPAQLESGSDVRGVLPLCDAGALGVGRAERALSRRFLPDERYAAARVGELEIALRDGRVAEVAVPADAPVLRAPTGGEFVLLGTLGGPVNRAAPWPDLVHLPSELVAPPAHGGARLGSATPTLLFRRLDVVAVSGYRWLSGNDTGLLRLAEDAELELPGGRSTDTDGFMTALAEGRLDGVAYEAAIDRVTSNTVRLTPADVDDDTVILTGTLAAPSGAGDEGNVVPAPLSDTWLEPRRPPDVRMPRARVESAPDAVADSVGRLPVRLWLADDAAIALPGGRRVDRGELTGALAAGELDGVVYRATVDWLTGETVHLAPVDGRS